MTSTVIATAGDAREAHREAARLSLQNIGRHRGVIGWDKNKTTGAFEIIQHEVNMPGPDTSCVTCGSEHHDGGCPAIKWA